MGNDPGRTGGGGRTSSLDTAQVVDTGILLLEREGEGGLGFNRVARELGVKPPSLYNHVADGADLERRVAIRGWSTFDRAAAGKALGLDGGEALRAHARAYRDFAREHEGLFHVMATVRLKPTDPEFAGVAGPLLERLATPMRDLGVAGDDVVHCVRAFRGAVHGFVLLESQRQFAAGAAVEESFERMLDLLIGGLER
jgi:AcrR family transcriptional regulator